MSDVIDFSLLAGQLTALDREMRLVRLQVDQIASSVNQLSPRMATLEQSFHGLVGEMARGFGQIQQQIARQESRISTMDAGLTALRLGMDANHAELIAVIKEIKLAP